MIESVCDDLLENADKKIDVIKQANSKTKVTSVDINAIKNRVKTENSLRKPQHAWIQDIDNSYHQFIPVLKKKEHFVETAYLSAEIRKA